MLIFFHGLVYSNINVYYVLGKSITDIVGPVQTLETKAQLKQSAPSANMPKGQQIQTISRLGTTPKTQVQAARSKGLKTLTKARGSFTQLQTQAKASQLKSTGQVGAQGNKTALAGRGRGLRGRGSTAQAGLARGQQQQHTQNQHPQQPGRPGNQQNQNQHPQQPGRPGNQQNQNQLGVNASQQNVVKNIVLQSGQHMQNSGDAQMQGNPAHQFAGRGQAFRGRGMNQGMNNGMNRGISRGMNRGTSPGMNRGIMPLMSRGMNLRMNQNISRGLVNRAMNTGMNRGFMNRGMMNRGMMNRPMNPGMMNRGMNQANFRGRGRAGGNQQGLVNSGQQGNTPFRGQSNNSRPQGNRPNVKLVVKGPLLGDQHMVSDDAEQAGQQLTLVSSRTVVTSPVQTRTVVKQSPLKAEVPSRTVVSKQPAAARGRGQANSGRVCLQLSVCCSLREVY